MWLMSNRKIFRIRTSNIRLDFLDFLDFLDYLKNLDKKNMHQFKELEIWKRSRLFCSEVYQVTASFPSDEKFGLTNQLRRALVSIPSNIAEGSSRNSNKDFSRFLEIAIGAAYEIETQVLIAFDLRFVSIEECEKLVNELAEIIKIISRFRSSLKI
jgi:four helix bundle protein